MKKLDSNFWKRYFKVYDVLNLVIPYQELLDDLCKELEIKRGDLILDAGSGTGNLAVKLKRLGARVIALDNEPEALKIHKKKDPQAETIYANLTQSLPFPDEYFDKIVCNNTIYTLSNLEAQNVLREFYRILRKNGVLVISNPYDKFKSSRIYYESINKDMKKRGKLTVIKDVIKLFYPTLKIFYFNCIIDKYLNKKRDYFIRQENDQKKMLEKEGFKISSKGKLAFGNQNIIHKAFK